AGAVELRLILHITQSEKAAYTGTMDSIDQGMKGIPLSSVELRNGNLKIAVDSVNGTYEGKVSADASSIDGEWSQGQPLPLRFTRGIASPKPESRPAKPSDIDGTWEGTRGAGAAKLRVVIHITNTSDGLTATLDSPDQNAKDIPATVRRNGSDLTIQVKGSAANSPARSQRILRPSTARGYRPATVFLCA